MVRVVSRRIKLIYVVRNYSDCSVGNRQRVSKVKTPGNSLVVQWLRLGTFTAWAQVRSLVRELRSWKPCGAAKKKKKVGFPGGAVVENPPANAGNTGSSPGLGRSHMPRSD